MTLGLSKLCFAVRDDGPQSFLVAEILQEFRNEAVIVEAAHRPGAGAIPVFVQEELFVRLGRLGTKLKRRSKFLRVGHTTSLYGNVSQTPPAELLQSRVCVALRPLSSIALEDSETLTRLRTAVYEATRVARRITNRIRDSDLAALRRNIARETHSSG